jgi:ribosomal subunit interface protein
MHKRIYFHGMEKSDVMEQYANQQLEKIIKFLEHEPTPVYIDLTFSPSKVREHHKVELRVKSPHYDLISEYEHQGTAFYETLDRVIDTMYRELHEKKRKRVDERKDQGKFQG